MMGKKRNIQKDPSQEGMDNPLQKLAPVYAIPSSHETYPNKETNSKAQSS
jgi:hypothetical protein